MTLTGITAEKFIQGSESQRDKLKASLASILQTSTENVEIFSIYNSGKDTTQILYAAHGSPWYDKSRLDGLAILNKEKLESDAGIKISEIPINECDGDNLCYTGGCVTEIEIEDKEYSMINTNFSSQTQVKAKAVGVCKCPARSSEVAVSRLAPRGSLEIAARNGRRVRRPGCGWLQGPWRGGRGRNPTGVGYGGADRSDP